MGEEERIVENTSQINNYKDYYVHLLVGIKEAHFHLVTLEEYVLTAWHNNSQPQDLSREKTKELSRRILEMQKHPLHMTLTTTMSWRFFSLWLVDKLKAQHGIKEPYQDNSHLVMDCLKYLICQLNKWCQEMEKFNTDRSQVFMEPEENKVDENDSKPLLETTVNPRKQIIDDDCTSARCCESREASFLTGNDPSFNNGVKDLMSQINYQQHQINTLLRTNQSYKQDYRNKLKTMSKNMAMKMTSVDREATEYLQSTNNDKSNYIFEKKLLYRIAFLGSQLDERAKEIQTLKNIVSYNRRTADSKLKNLQKEFDDYKAEYNILSTRNTGCFCLCKDEVIKFDDLLNKMDSLKKDNKTLRRLLSQEKSRLSNSYKDISHRHP